MLQEEIKRRDEKINELRTKLSRMEINLTESQFDKELVTRRADKSQAQTKVGWLYAFCESRLSLQRVIYVDLHHCFGSIIAI